MDYEEKARAPIRFSFVLWIGLFILTLVLSILIASLNERISLASLPWSVEQNDVNEVEDKTNQ